MKSFVCNFDDEVHVDFLWVEVLNEFVGCHSCAARCQEVVMNQYNVIFVDGVDVHLDGIDTTPYSFENDSLMTVAGSLPGFRASTTPQPSLPASAEAITKPRLSMPTIFVMPLSL